MRLSVTKAFVFAAFLGLALTFSEGWGGLTAGAGNDDIPDSVKRGAAQVQVTATPAPASGWTQSDVLSWIWTFFGGLAATAIGKIAFLPSQTGEKPQGLTDLISKIKDPAHRQALDTLLLQAIQSGVPGTVLQTGLSAIPGAGPIVSQVEPIVRQLVTRILSERLASLNLPQSPAIPPAPTLTPTTGPLPAPPSSDAALKALEDVLAQLKNLSTLNRT